MSYTADLSAADVRTGGKARSLAELSGCGLPTPAGFVITDDLLRALCPRLPAQLCVDQSGLAVLDGLREQLARAPWPVGFFDELEGRLRALQATSLAVRSSFASEDRAGGLAAGVYDSRVGVAPERLGTALREVLGSAFQPGAVAYALAHGDEPLGGPFAVLVHAYVAGDAQGAAALASPRSAPIIDCQRGRLTDAARSQLVVALEALAGRRGAVEVEWVWDGERVVFLQARPYQPPRAAAAWPGFLELGVAESPALWRWDAAHNPLPLSPAQAGLVELVDEACRIGLRQRVLGGYLFYAPDDRPLPPAIPCEQAEAFFASLREEVEARLSRLGRSPALADALALFVHAYQPIFGVLQPALRRVHRDLRDFLAQHFPAGLAMLPALRSGVQSLASERLRRAERLAGAGSEAERAAARADYLTLFGDEASTWDVAVPTYAERPEGLRVGPRPGAPVTADWQQARAKVEAAIDEGLREEWRRRLDLARVAVALGEADDWLYARVQAAVRRALLALGQGLRDRGALSEVSEAFFLPLSLLRQLDRADAVVPPDRDLIALAAQASRANAAATAVPPPLGETSPGPTIRGIGVGGRAIGRVALHRPGTAPDGAAAAVLVAATLLPTELPLIAAAALVVETGGPLDHVAAQARERGLPAVVGARGASAALDPGNLVLVDGDRGLVVRLGS
jgi:phosphohistidine swiveling domain-containing protein